jgi:predicted nucleic-acid-binding protein
MWLSLGAHPDPGDRSKMIGLDTNVLVRYLTEDDPVQTKAAGRVMDSLSPDLPGFISLIALTELVWVLESFYRFKKNEIEQVLETLLRSEELVLERAEIISQALRAFRSSRADFADCLIERCGHAAGCKHTLTFDHDAVSGAGMLPI